MRDVGAAWQAETVPPRRSPASRSATARALSWDTVDLAEVVLVKGSEGLMADRAVSRLIDLARQVDPATEISEFEAAGYERKQLEMLTSPSLFGERRLVLVRSLESATDDLVTELLALVASPAPDVWLVLQHGGGQRGKKLLDSVAANYPVVACEPLKRDADKAEFVTAEFSRASRRISGPAVQALVQAVGSDLRELAAACAQLIADTTGAVTPEVVARYHGGRVEATGFRVADAAVAGQAGTAVTLLRHALDTGADPVPLVAALAAKLRAMAKVDAVSGRGRISAADLGLAPWQVDRARRDLAGWTPEGLAAAISAVAAADAEVKGLSRDPVFALERAVLRVAGSRRRR